MVAFTGWSPTLGIGAANVGATSGTIQKDGSTQRDDQISKLLRVPGVRKFRRLMRVLVNGAVGDTATETRSRVTAVSGLTDPNAYSGAVAIESQSIINRATTTADRDAILEVIDNTSAIAPASYPVDASGNGGGGKLGR